MRSFHFFLSRRRVWWGIVLVLGGMTVGLVHVKDHPNSMKDSAGYVARHEEELRKISNLSVEDFAEKFKSSRHYLTKLDWDPTLARFWPVFEKSVFKLNPEELSVFKTNGFVVSERLGQNSFGSFFATLYHSDLPVFVSADAVLHAWHRSYDAILEQLETIRFSPQLDKILSSMATALPAANREYGQGVLSQSLNDADYFLAVARSLLKGNIVPCILAPRNKSVSKTIKSINQMDMGEMNLFGDRRVMDYSLFKPRGHYEKSDYLRRYFRCMMWCGVVDFHLDPKAPRGLGTAIVLHDLLRRSGQFESWTHFDRIMQSFVGWADSMTFSQLSKILEESAIRSPSQIENLAELSFIEDRIIKSSLGTQAIHGTGFSPNYLGSEKGELHPRSFTVMGQRFVLDSWTTSNVVEGKRRIPSALDVAFAVLGNDHVSPLIVERIKNPKGQTFRDGIPYQNDLTAVRRIIDDQKQDFWSDNLYLGWLGLLRTLSAPTTDPHFPQSMRTQAWAMKTLNSQLASWTQMRHDTILYVKQSFTKTAGCLYPTGFVEPRIDFWRRFQGMTERAATILDEAKLPGQAAFCRQFSGTVKILATLADKEIAQVPFSTEENKFLKDILEIKQSPGICAPGPTYYNGWYPKLFYNGGSDSCEWDALVADVHTDSPDPDLGDSGCVLHEAVGNVDAMLIAVDNGPDLTVYAGPVFSHYEFHTPTGQRKTDREWRRDINQGKLPPRPEWTRSYLVPGKNPNAPFYKVNEGGD